MINYVRLRKTMKYETAALTICNHRIKHCLYETTAGKRACGIHRIGAKRNLSVAVHVAVHKSKGHHIKIDLRVGDSHQYIFLQVE